MTAAESIVREHGPRILKHLSSYNITPAEREDSYSRVCLLLVEKAHQFEGRSAITSWLHRVTVNVVLELVRKASYRNERGGHDDEDLERASEAGHAREPSPESQMNRAQTLHRSLLHLNASDRALLTNFYLEGMPMAEIASSLGVSEDMIKQRLFRARKKARDSYEGKVREPYAHNKNRKKKAS